MAEKRLKMVSFRASDDEIARIKALTADIQKRHPYVKEADVLRELVGLVDTGIITAGLRKRLLSTSSHEAELVETGFKAKIKSGSLPLVDDVDLKESDAWEVRKGKG